jgi:hypothetical protein
MDAAKFLLRVTMAKRKRNRKLKFRNKRANKGRKPTAGRHRTSW